MDKADWIVLTAIVWVFNNLDFIRDYWHESVHVIYIVDVILEDTVSKKTYVSEIWSDLAEKTRAIRFFLRGLADVDTEDENKNEVTVLHVEGIFIHMLIRILNWVVKHWKAKNDKVRVVVSYINVGLGIRIDEVGNRITLQDVANVVEISGKDY